MKNLVLASKSPRRKEILSRENIKFMVEESSFEESSKNLSPTETVVFNAKGKATEVYTRLNDKNIVVLGADTVVFINGELLGKPKTEIDAFNMLKKLSNNAHEVVTGYAVASEKGVETGYVKTEVIFNQLSDRLISDYIKTGSPMDKAGAYGIQDNFGIVNRISGSYDNVVGLPIEEIKHALEKALKD